ncbi:MAG: Ig-like domain-containing protein, partial [Cyclobacteriaceae bacterium]|nr:Ig-like domain-containing protein [Cyclobacteriaceae bacterium]
VNDETGTVIGLPVVINVLANDPSPAISPVIVTGPSFGTAVVNGDNTITYTPTSGYKGEDTFTYKICSDAGAVVATVSISVVDGIAILKDSTEDLGVPAVSDAIKYAWTGFPVGAKITYTNTILPQVSPPTVIGATADIIETTIPSLTIDWTGIAPGTYTICVSALNECGESTQTCTDVVIAAEIPVPAYDVEGDVSNAYCDGGGSITNVDVLVAGVSGDPLNFTYSWTGPDSFTSSSKDLVSGLAQGEYVLTVRNLSDEVVAIKYFYIEYSCLGVAKEVSAGPVSNGDGTYLLSYRIKVENSGTTTINSIQVVEDLAATYLDATSFEVLDISSSNFTVNPDFDGDTDKNLILTSALGNLNSNSSG